MGKVLNINTRQIEQATRSLEEATTPLAVIELAIADVEARPCRNVEYCAGYAQGVIAAYFMDDAITTDEYEIAHERLLAAHRAALEAEMA